MAKTIYETYLEAEVLAAEPLALVHMLYRGAIEAVVQARRRLCEGAIRERSRQITKAWEILHHLSNTLDCERAPELGRRLAGLYAYMQGRLLEANARQADEPLAEVESLLTQLGEAWRAACPQAVHTGEVEPVSCAY